jgi:DhnA family fructose-bisphosphate aldolase class Ia
MITSQHSVGKIIRMGQLVNAESQRTVTVAIDHGLGGMVAGIDHLEPALEKIIAAEPDAIIMSMGVAKRFGHLFGGRGKPSIIITVDRRLNSTLPGHSDRGEEYRLLVNVEDALLIGAAAVKMVMIYGRSTLPVHADNVEAVAEIARQCDRYRVPLLLEPVLWGKLATEADKENLNVLKHICRMGFEWGADILKINYTGDVATFRDVVETCPISIVILGGSKMDTERDVLATAAGAMKAGASGVAFGRNVFQHPDPTAIIGALRQIVHEGASVKSALENMQLHLSKSDEHNHKIDRNSNLNST